MVTLPDGSQQMMPVAQPVGVSTVAQSMSSLDYPRRRLGMDEAFKRFWKKYARFNGRASVGEYWWVILAQFLVMLPLMVLIVVGAVPLVNGEEAGLVLAGIAGGLSGLAIMVPLLALLVRRLHDTGRAGPYVLLSLIPLVGAIIVLVFCIQEGTRGANAYGFDDPAA